MTALLEVFREWVDQSIDAEGVYPFPALSLDADGNTAVHALDLTPSQVWAHVWNLIACEGATEVIFALDRSTRPGQGTEFAVVLTCAHWHPSFHESWTHVACRSAWQATDLVRAWRPFVINYQHEPRIVRAPDFNNAFWNGHILSELSATCPPLRLQVTKK